MDPLEMAQQTTNGAAALMDGLKPEDLARPTPCEGWDVRALINHMIGVNARFAAAVSREGTPPDASADLVGDDPAASYRAAAQKTMAVFRAPGALDKTFRLGVFFVDQLQHAWDLAQALGRSYTLDPALATAALEMSRQGIGPDRRGPGKPFGDEVPCSEDAPIQDRLAAFLGRQPRDESS